MKNILLFTLCCCILFLGESCKKSPDPIPEPPYNPIDELPDPYDNPNRAVFGCLIDGKVWKPAGAFNNPSYTYHDPSGQFNISAKNLLDNKFEQIGLVVKFSSTGNYKMLNTYPYVNEKLCNDQWSYALDTIAYNNVTIESFLEEDGVIIGKFEFTAINNECSDTIRVTEGRFKATL